MVGLLSRVSKIKVKYSIFLSFFAGLHQVLKKLNSILAAKRSIIFAN